MTGGHLAGADPGFQVRVGAFRVKYHNFTPKNIFFPIAEGGTNFFWVFRVKNHDFMPKNHFFSIFRIRPCLVQV